MASEKGGRLVSTKSREIVQEFLSLSSSVSSPGTVLEKLDGCAIRMGRAADEVVPALAEALDEEDGKKRIVAAWLLINLAGPRPDMVTEVGLAERAENMLIRAGERRRGKSLVRVDILNLGSRAPRGGWRLARTARS